MHDTGGHMSGGDTSSFGHTALTGSSSAGAPGAYNPAQNPNDVFYYANGGASYTNGGTPWPASSARSRRRGSPGVIVFPVIALAVLLPILITLITLRLI